ncbi:hypothetical protein A2303_02005 [Candidatus Falkowbacteria bacterium RIFOXYB2_FULL_47_14]|uniref:Uncharacterized protein n=1 Tax=Candidatus Falkowbacteria bacterium RIFOXYA2_FULL_47_19 TaxID=1797994 RepID=A0A1F5SN67_9BACT|nr:MAG: hypothetical protein A2227_06685 [Candidatus Falkowbacteria bacterium RIFOXYA2_FULL_47_19]OGF34606.1 MAG: hypothetical protein A2468_07910 [Candidatus Falkowbacteria bacterium RIFOXYC2_FULL_46_15]OGF43225.1 MAG: hypothetical protein A2303_02005 [Candidatus Falkowbacteria bacterium RIFOXYB2_FULL_47_14]
MQDKYKDKGKRYWKEDYYMDDLARHLSMKAQCVYDCLKRHCNADRKTTIGSRKIGEKIGIDKGTVQSGLNELIKKNFISARSSNSSDGYYFIYPLNEVFGQSLGGKNSVTELEQQSVPNGYNSQKELKNYIKEENNKNVKPETLIKLRRNLEEKGIVRPII